jgi:hypothetical protein
MDGAGLAVVARHLAAVRSGSPEAMASDYADNATLERPGAVYQGRDAIVAYFVDVPRRLAGRRVSFDPPRLDGDSILVAWRLTGGTDDTPVRGHDRYWVHEGLIVHQRVELEVSDF